MADKITIDSYNKIAKEYHDRNAKTMWRKEYQIFELLLGEGEIFLKLGVVQVETLQN